MATVVQRDTTPLDKVDVDPVTLDLIENGLRNARYEMDEVLFRTALSPGIREQHDEFPLIADPRGKMVVGQFGLSIPDFLDGFDGEIGEGDVLLPPTRTPAAPRSATPTTGWWCCRSTSADGWSGGRPCSATCPTSAARRRVPCPPTRAR